MRVLTPAGVAIVAAKIDPRRSEERSVLTALSVWQAAAAAGLLEDVDGAVVASLEDLARFADVHRGTMRAHVGRAVAAGVLMADRPAAGRTRTRWTVQRPSRWTVAWRAGPAALVGQILDTRLAEAGGMFHVGRGRQALARDAGVARYQEFARDAGVASGDPLARDAWVARNGACSATPPSRAGRAVARDASVARNGQGSSSTAGSNDEFPSSEGGKEDVAPSPWVSAICRALAESTGGRMVVYKNSRTMHRIRIAAAGLANEAELSEAVAWIVKQRFEHVESGSVEFMRWVDTRRLALPDPAPSEAATLIDEAEMDRRRRENWRAAGIDVDEAEHLPAVPFSRGRRMTTEHQNEPSEVGTP